MTQEEIVKFILANPSVAEQLEAIRAKILSTQPCQLLRSEPMR